MKALARHALTALLLFCIVFRAGAQPATQPADRSAVGMNTNGVSYYDPSAPFIDEMKSAGTLGSPTVSGSPNEPDSPGYDENGWPTGDFATYLSSGRPVWPGTHKVIAGGKVDRIALSASAGTVENLRYDPAANVTTADVVIPTNGNQIVLRFTGTQRNPANAAEGKGVRFAQVLAPGYEAPATPETGVFTREYLRAWQPFGHARLMALNQTNSHPVGTWAERSKPTDARWGTDKGVPWEVQA
jgi:hypothetical protein